MELQPKFNGERGAEFHKTWLKFSENSRRHQDEASSILFNKWRCAAEHPDDGWVDRRENTVLLCYPKFQNKIMKGSRIALGWPFSGYRIVEVTEVIEGIISGTRYRFKEVAKIKIEEPPECK